MRIVSINEKVLVLVFEKHWLIYRKACDLYLRRKLKVGGQNKISHFTEASAPFITGNAGNAYGPDRTQKNLLRPCEINP
jgi:hypothetical protein